jgi:hypothetical protein
MAFTDNCSVFATLHEDAINKVISHMMSQRPSLLNYATRFFARNTHRMCKPIMVAPGLPLNQPLVSLQPYLSVPGTNFGLDYFAQITKLSIDFHPGKTIAIPKELAPPLKDQKIALELEFCIGLGCASPWLLAKIGDDEAATVSPRFAKAKADDFPNSNDEENPIVIKPIPTDGEVIHCFCVKVFAVCSFSEVADKFGRRLKLNLEGLEIVDIAPPGLESILECVIKASLIVGFLPRFRISLDSYALSIGEYGQLAIQATPVSANVPYNPDVSNDRLSLFLNLW